MCLAEKMIKEIRFGGGKDNHTGLIANVCGVLKQSDEREVQIGALIQLDP